MSRLIQIILRINFLFIISLIIVYFLSRVLLVDVKVVQKIYYLFPLSLFILFLEINLNKYAKEKNIIITNLVTCTTLATLILLPASKNFSELVQNSLNSIFIVAGLIFVYLLNYYKKGNESAIISKTNGNFLLLSLLIFFLILKLPLLSSSFTGNNTIKYNTYVEPAIYMVKNNNPFVVNIKYLANPITHRDGINKEIIGVPTLEWFLALTYKIFGLENLELKTRIATNIIGLLILIFSYKTIKIIANKTVSLFFLFLLITNPLFLLITQLTVYDSVILLFFLISFLFFLKYQKYNKEKFLIYSSTIFSLAFLSKEVAILWGLPFYFFYIILKSRKSLRNAISDLSIFIMFMAIPYAFFKLWVEILKVDRNVSLIVPILLFSLIYLSAKKAEIIYRKSLIVSDLLLKNKYVLYFIILIGVLLLAFVFKLKASSWSEFITDKEIIFYWPMYEYILKLRQVFYMSELLFVCSLLGFIAVFKNRLVEQKFKIFIASFAIGLAIYLVLASKVIFFHNYYNINFIFFYLLGSAYFLYLATKDLGLIAKVLFVSFFSLLIYKANYGIREELLLQEKEGFKDLSSYMINNNQPNTFYIDNDNTLSLTISTGMPRITNLNYEAIQQDIKEIGFSNAMKKHKIKYLVASQEIDYKKYAPAFMNFDLKKLEANDRSSLIHIKFNETDSNNYPPEVVNKAKDLEMLNLFDLEAEIGDYKVYNLWNN